VQSQERLRRSELGAIFNVVELKCELWRGELGYIGVSGSGVSLSLSVLTIATTLIY
jgi:hypothetical protein